VGFNALIEKSSRRYHERMVRWVSIALEEGIRFFVTSLGNPRWVVERVHEAGGFVYHDVTEKKWALRAVDAGVDGLIAVNDRAGGHPGKLSAEVLLDELGHLKLPVVCAGGIATPQQFREVIAMGYAGAQLGTRFIATPEARATPGYKEALMRAREEDTVVSRAFTGKTLRALRNKTTQYFEEHPEELKPFPEQIFVAMQRGWMHLGGDAQTAEVDPERECYPAGQGTGAIHELVPAGELVRRFVEEAEATLDRIAGLRVQPAAGHADRRG
jgi:NAD(P)H-dependent flavin oxidoreductase YrpB (nitropropane dioxygenase family)